MAGIMNNFRASALLVAAIIVCAVIQHVSCTACFHQPIDAEKRGVNTYISDSDLTSDFCQSYLSEPGTKLQITPLVVKLGDDPIHNYVCINEGLLSTSSMSTADEVRVEAVSTNKAAKFQPIAVTSNVATVTVHRSNKASNKTNQRFVIMEVRTFGCAYTNLLAFGERVTLYKEGNKERVRDKHGLTMLVEPFNKSSSSYTATVSCTEGYTLAEGQTSTTVTCTESFTKYSWDYANLNCTGPVGGISATESAVRQKVQQSATTEKQVTTNIGFILGLAIGIPCFIGIIALIAVLSSKGAKKRKKKFRRGVSVAEPSSMLDPSLPSPRHTQNVYNNNPTIIVARDSVYYVNHSATSSTFESPQKPATQVYKNSAYNEVLYDQPEDLSPMRTSLGASFGASYMVMGDVTMKPVRDERKESPHCMLLASSDTYGSLKGKSDLVASNQYYNSRQMALSGNPAKKEFYEQIEQSTESHIYTTVPEL